MSIKRRVISEEEISNICKEYISGKSIRYLQKTTKLQGHQIKKILLNSNIEVLSAYETQKKNANIDDIEYFDKLGPLQCYVLGIIFGDGCVHYNEKKYKYALTITSNDLDILESAKHMFGDKFNIVKRKNANAYNFCINSKTLCKELIEKFKLQSPKSDSLIWPKLPDDMYSFFISGLLSTDGCIEIIKNRPYNPLVFSYCSNCLDFVKNLQNYLISKLNLTETKIKVSIKNRKNPNYVLRYTGHQAKLILDYIYNKTNYLTRCDRKYKLFLIS